MDHDRDNPASSFAAMLEAARGRMSIGGTIVEVREVEFGRPFYVLSRAGAATTDGE